MSSLGGDYQGPYDWDPQTSQHWKTLGLPTWHPWIQRKGNHRDENQGLNLTFEVNSQMASTWSGFTSQKCISTSQVYSTKLSFLEIKKTRENVKLLLLSNCNQFIIQLKIKFIVHSHACSLYLQLTQQQQETQLYCYRHYFFLWL